MNPKAIRFTPEQREEMRTRTVKAYAGGATFAEVAKKLGCSFGTVRNLLLESDVELRPHNPHPTDLPEGMLTSTEAAALIGIGRASFLAMQHQGYGPPRAERPEGAHGRYTYYWRTDVEQWLKERADRRLERVRRAEHHRELLAARPGPKHTADWAALFADVDAKRQAEGMSWEMVARLSNVNASQISRLRNGQAGNNWGTFLRILAWLEDGLPDPLRKYVTEVPATGRSAQAA